MMDKKEYSDLRNDIKKNGLMEPIITLNGTILDGRNRYVACNELNIKPTTKEFSGDDPLQYVMSTNLQRRNLNPSQKAMVGRRWKVHYSIMAKERQIKSNVEPVPQDQQGRARDQAGEIAGVSGRYIDMAEEVIAKKTHCSRTSINEWIDSYNFSKVSPATLNASHQSYTGLTIKLPQVASWILFIVHSPYPKQLQSRNRLSRCFPFQTQLQFSLNNPPLIKNLLSLF